MLRCVRPAHHWMHARERLTEPDSHGRRTHARGYVQSLRHYEKRGRREGEPLTLASLLIPPQLAVSPRLSVRRRTSRFVSAHWQLQPCTANAWRDGVRWRDLLGCPTPVCRRHRRDRRWRGPRPPRRLACRLRRRPGRVTVYQSNPIRRHRARHSLQAHQVMQPILTTALT